MDKYKVVITGRVLPSVLELIQTHCQVYQWNQARQPLLTDISEWLSDAEGLFVTMNMPVNEQLLALAPKLKVIVQSAVGYDNIDIPACTRHRIPFCNTPGVLVETTADLAFGLLLTSARRIHEGWEWVRAGNWQNGTHFPFGVDLYNKTLGIVGMGAIGSAVAKRGQAFGMKIIYHNRKRLPVHSSVQAEYRSFDELLTKADFIIVLTPLTTETRGMFGAKEFARMKPTAYFVNAARGAVVDTEALYNALAARQIAYAALDVTDPEPLPGDHPLLQLPNILVVPHIGSATMETRTRMGMLAAENLLSGLEGRPLVTCVNPEAIK